MVAAVTLVNAMSGDGMVSRRGNVIEGGMSPFSTPKGSVRGGFRPYKPMVCARRMVANA